MPTNITHEFFSENRKKLEVCWIKGRCAGYSTQSITPWTTEAMLRGKPHIRSLDGTMATLLGVVFPLEDIVLELDMFRGCCGSRGCAAAAGGVPFTCKKRQMSHLIFAHGFRETHVLLSWHVISLWYRRGWSKCSWLITSTRQFSVCTLVAEFARVPDCVCVVCSAFRRSCMSRVL
jgi:hypothetical protein